MPTDRPTPSGDGNPIPEDAQRIFDVVTGPNLRLKDNLIQLAIIVVGTVLCAGAGAAWAHSSGKELLAGLLLGGLGGAIVSLFLSGAILGLIRFITAVRGR
jgi:hypothetical protein